MPLGRLLRGRHGSVSVHLHAFVFAERPTGLYTGAIHAAPGTQEARRQKGSRHHSRTKRRRRPIDFDENEDVRRLGMVAALADIVSALGQSKQNICPTRPQPRNS